MTELEQAIELLEKLSPEEKNLQAARHPCAASESTRREAAHPRARKAKNLARQVFCYQFFYRLIFFGS